MTERDAANSMADQIIGRVQIASAAASREFRRALVRRIERIYRRWGPGAQFVAEATEAIHEIVAAYASVNAGMLADLKIAGYVHGAAEVNGKLRGDLRRLFEESAEKLPPITPRGPLGIYPPGDDGPTIRLPKLEEAARDLKVRRIVTPQEFYDVASRARRSAQFTVSGFEQPTINRIRDALTETMREGPSLTGFIERMDEAAITSPLGPGHMENVYRTNTIAAFAAGEDKILSNPVIGDTFPYSKRLPIRDPRLTELCEILARSGIDGSAIMRRDDPIYRMFRRPSHFSCRCSEAFLSAKEAARQGISEAQEYIETGVWPSVRAWVSFPNLTPEARATWESWTRYRGAQENAA
jgi:hypothetical protein